MEIQAAENRVALVHGSRFRSGCGYNRKRKNYPIETTAIITGVDHMKNDTIGQFELEIDKPCDANGPCGEQENSASKMKNRKGVENSGVVFST